MLQTLHPKSQIAIYDDQDDSRETTAEYVYDAGFTPIPIDSPIYDLEECIKHLYKFDAALVDHRLSPGNFGEYEGAQVVSELYKKKKPALLITAWAEGDPEAIQPYKRHLPNVIKKDDENLIEGIIQGFDNCVNEINDFYTLERNPVKTIMVIASNYNEETDLKRVNAFLPSWNPYEGITFPVEIIPIDLRKHLKQDVCFSVFSNTGAKSQHDLFFYDFALAPEPD